MTISGDAPPMSEATSTIPDERAGPEQRGGAPSP